MQRAMNRQGRHLLGQWRPDVVHAHDWVVAAAATTLSRASGAPLVATVHATEAGRHDGWIVGPLSQAVHRREVRLASAASAVIVCSRAMEGEVVAALGPFKAPVIMIPNGIDLDAWQASEAESVAARARLGVTPSAPMLVYTGRLAHEKGVGTLVGAMPAVLDGLSDTRLIIAGRGPLESTLRAQVTALELDAAVTCAGFLPEHELRALVAAANCVVVPSLYEPFGLVALEAGALGTPVVASAVGGLAEIITDDVTGLLVAPGDSVPLAAAILRVLRDPSLATGFADAARSGVAADYSWPLIAQRTVDAYQNCGPPPDARSALERIPDMNVLTGEPA